MFEFFLLKKEKVHMSFWVKICSFKKTSFQKNLIFFLNTDFQGFKAWFKFACTLPLKRYFPKKSYKIDNCPYQISYRTHHLIKIKTLFLRQFYFCVYSSESSSKSNSQLKLEFIVSIVSLFMDGFFVSFLIFSSFYDKFRNRI